MIMNHLSFLSRIACVVALTVFAVSSANAQVSTVVINDSFADGNRAVSGMSGADVEGDFFTSTNSNAIEDSVGSLGLVSGPSGRGIHATFATQSLNTVGDQLIFSYTFTTPDSIEGFVPGMPTGVGGESSAFRVGLFDAANVPGGVSAVSTDFTSSTNTIWENLTGFLLDHDVNTGSADLNFRERNAPGPANDRLLSTTGDFSSIGSSSSPDGEYEFVVNETYTGSITVTRNATDVTLDASISGGPGVGGTTHSVNYTPASFDFNLLAFNANGNNFGTSSSVDTPDNGIDFSNISVEFITSVPEPGSAMLLLSGLGVLGMVRRRR